MSMDLTTNCPHCKAMKGQICSRECEVNGKYIKELDKVLSQLDLRIAAIQLEEEIRYELREVIQYAGPEEELSLRGQSREHIGIRK